jgi:putative hemolysin
MLARTFDTSYSPYRAPTHPSQPLPSASAIDAEVFPHHGDGIPPGVVEAGSYDLRYAWTRADLHAVQALRHRVFAEEFGHVTPTTGPEPRDDDARDPWFHHLMIVHRESGTVVGTYRLQTAVMAATRFGFYSATLFELGAIPAGVLQEAVEIGRAAVDAGHRSGRVLHLLWRGLARYLSWNSKRFLFGCCSISGLDEQQASATWRTIHARDALHEWLLVRPRPAARALADDGRMRPVVDADSPQAPLPPLFEGYLALGARVCGAPALDREFGTTDYLVLLDVQEMPSRAVKTFFG